MIPRSIMSRGYLCAYRIYLDQACPTRNPLSRQPRPTRYTSADLGIETEQKKKSKPYSLLYGFVRPASPSPPSSTVISIHIIQACETGPIECLDQRDKARRQCLVKYSRSCLAFNAKDGAYLSLPITNEKATTHLMRQALGHNMRAYYN